MRRTIVFLSVLAVTNLPAQPSEGDPPFQYGTVYIDLSGRLITSSDPTVFEGIVYHQRRPELMYDNRVKGYVMSPAHSLTATFMDGLRVSFLVNAELGERADAEREASKYAKALGRLPRLLRLESDKVYIHEGQSRMVAGHNSIVIHVGFARELEARHFLEEGLVHEGAHISIGDVLGEEDTRAWLKAQEADGVFISNYALDSPFVEDIPESFSAYLYVTHLSDRIARDAREKIQLAIPNRLEFFREYIVRRGETGLWCPIVLPDCPEDVIEKLT